MEAGSPRRGRGTDLNRTEGSVSLIAFHRFLIATGIVFCFGFAIWELMTWWVGRTQDALVLGVVFLVLGAGLAFYLTRLRRFLGTDDAAREHPAPRPR